MSRLKVFLKHLFHRVAFYCLICSLQVKQKVCYELLDIFFDNQMAEKIITPLVSVHLKEQFTQKSVIISFLHVDEKSGEVAGEKVKR